MSKVQMAQGRLLLRAVDLQLPCEGLRGRTWLGRNRADTEHPGVKRQVGAKGGRNASCEIGVIGERSGEMVGCFLSRSWEGAGLQPARKTAGSPGCFANEGRRLFRVRWLFLVLHNQVQQGPCSGDAATSLLCKNRKVRLSVESLCGAVECTVAPFRATLAKTPPSARVGRNFGLHLPGVYFPRLRGRPARRLRWHHLPARTCLKPLTSWPYR